MTSIQLLPTLDRQRSTPLHPSLSRYPASTRFATGEFSTGLEKIGSTLYLTTFAAGGACKLYKSTNNGTSWTFVINIEATGYTHPNCAANGDGTYLLITYKDGSGVYFKRFNVAAGTLSARQDVVTANADDPQVIYRSGSFPSETLWVVSGIVGATRDIKSYESSDSGDTWQLSETIHSEALVGINGLEDFGLHNLNDGKLLLTWEREVTERGGSSIRSRIHDGATWGSENTLVDNSTFDDEGPCVFADPEGVPDVHYLLYSSNKGGLATYWGNNLYLRRSINNGATFTTEVQISDSTGQVEYQAVPIGRGRFIVVSTRLYHTSTSQVFLTSAVYRHGDYPMLSALGLKTESGTLFVRKDEGRTWLESWGVEGDSARSMHLFEAAQETGIRFSCKAKSPASVTPDIRIYFGYQSTANHYVWNFTNNTSFIYERVSGTYNALNQVAHNMVIDQTYRMVIEFYETVIGTMRIRAWIDGTLVHNITNTRYLKGRVGIGASHTWTKCPSMFRDISLANSRFHLPANDMDERDFNWEDFITE